LSWTSDEDERRLPGTSIEPRLLRPISINTSQVGSDLRQNCNICTAYIDGIDGDSGSTLTGKMLNQIRAAGLLVIHIALRSLFFIF
jgi:hypothetical protein